MIHYSDRIYIEKLKYCFVIIKILYLNVLSLKRIDGRRSRFSKFSPCPHHFFSLSFALAKVRQCDNHKTRDTNATLERFQSPS